ncbi:MAG: hypothetical protein RL418_92 [Actinomycetota bacterium]
MKFDHVGLSVADLDAQVAWYAASLSLRATMPFEVPPLQLRGCFMVNEQGVVLELLERQGSRPGLQANSPVEALLTRGYGHLALRVEDVESTYRKLVELGAKPIHQPQPAPEPGVMFAFVADPEGNLIELLDRKTPVH